MSGPSGRNAASISISRGACEAAYARAEEASQCAANRPGILRGLAILRVAMGIDRIVQVAVRSRDMAGGR